MFNGCPNHFLLFCPSINSILKLTTVWEITGKIIRTANTVTDAQNNGEFLQFQV